MLREIIEKPDKMEGEMSTLKNTTLPLAVSNSGEVALTPN
jgi:hypothetical protein